MSAHYQDQDHGEQNCDTVSLSSLEPNRISLCIIPSVSAHETTSVAFPSGDIFFQSAGFSQNERHSCSVEEKDLVADWRSCRRNAKVLLLSHNHSSSKSTIHEGVRLGPRPLYALYRLLHAPQHVESVSDQNPNPSIWGIERETIRREHVQKFHAERFNQNPPLVRRVSVFESKE